MARLRDWMGLVMLCVASNGAAAAPPTGAAANEPNAVNDEIERELEQELRRETALPAPTLEVRYDGIDSKRYALLSAQFRIDNTPLALPAKLPASDGKSAVLYFGIMSPGGHALSAQLVFGAPENAVFSDVAGYRFKLAARLMVVAERGLVLTVRLRVEVNDGAPQMSKRLELFTRVDPRMVANLEGEDVVSDADDAPEPVLPPTSPEAKAPPTPQPAHRPHHVHHLKAFTQMKTGTWSKGEETKLEPVISNRALQNALRRARQEVRHGN